MIEKILMWLIGLLKEVQERRTKNEKDVQYLCSHLVVSLERYVDSCAAVVGDDGLCYGQPDQNGYHVAQVERPELGIETYNSELKALPTQLMHALVQFPREIELANARISGASEHASPPDYSEAFEERQYQYGKLGLKAHSLAAELRSLAAMPPRDFGEWRVLDYISEQLKSIEEYRSRRMEENYKFWQSLQKSSGGA